MTNRQRHNTSIFIKSKNRLLGVTWGVGMIAQIGSSRSHLILLNIAAPLQRTGLTRLQGRLSRVILILLNGPVGPLLLLIGSLSTLRYLLGAVEELGRGAFAHGALDRMYDVFVDLEIHA